MNDHQSLRSTLEQLCDFDTALLANTIGYIDPTPAHELYMGGSIQSVTPTLGPTVGIAVTCEIDTSTPNHKADVEGYWRQLDEMSRMGVPSVWVVKTVGSRPDHECVIGDGMAKTLRSVGCVGLVTDGGVRDIPGLMNVPFAAYCRGTVIHHTGLRITRIGEAVEVGGIVVRPGDVIHANAEGVIKIPRKCLDRLADNAVRMRAFEHEAHRLLRQTDLSLDAKKKGVGGLIAKFGFADCVTSTK
jgi:4-hydroxy-4-methyl-2-oxoglutarate aldolase